MYERLVHDLPILACMLRAYTMKPSRTLVPQARKGVSLLRESRAAYPHALTRMRARIALALTALHLQGKARQSEVKHKTVQGRHDKYKFTERLSEQVQRIEFCSWQHTFAVSRRY